MFVHTSFLERNAQSSRVSAASYFPCLLYNAPRFLSVVVTVGESTLAALCHPPYSVYGAAPILLFLFSSRSSATCHIGLLSPVTLFLFCLKKSYKYKNFSFNIFRFVLEHRKNRIFMKLNNN